MHRRGLESLLRLPHVVGTLLCQPQMGLASTLHPQPGLDTQGHFRRDSSAVIEHHQPQRAGHAPLMEKCFQAFMPERLDHPGLDRVTLRGRVVFCFSAVACGLCRMICTTIPAEFSSYSVRLLKEWRRPCKVKPSRPATLQAMTLGLLGLLTGVSVLGLKNTWFPMVRRMSLCACGQRRQGGEKVHGFG